MYRWQIGAAAQKQQRCGESCQQCRINQVSTAPADSLNEKLRCRPAHSRGEAAGEREHGDRRACRAAEDPAERRKSGIVERCCHGNADRGPGGKVARDTRRPNKRNKPCGADQRADRHDHMATEAINRAAHIAGAQAADEQSDGKSGHGEGRRPAVIGGDQRYRQHRWIKQGAPGQNLGNAEHAHGAPGTEVECARAWHERRSLEKQAGKPAIAGRSPLQLEHR